MDNPLQIYYCDDDTDDQLFFLEAIVPADVMLTLFNCADVMLRALESEAVLPSIIFLDLNMPVKDGFETLASIREKEKFRTLPVVILSTSATPMCITKTYELGASLYVTKPKSVQQLRSSLQEILSINWGSFNRSQGNFMFKYNTSP